MSESEDKSYKKHQHGKVFKKRFNFKDRYKYNNNLSSNVSVRPSNSQILFYGNSAMVIVLTTGYWPTAPSALSIILPTELVMIQVVVD